VYTPIAVTMAMAEVILVLLGTHAAFPAVLVWVPAVVGLALAVAAFRGAATGADGPLRTFWRRLAVAMGFVLVASLSQVADITTTTAWTGLPPVGARTLLLYVAGTLLAITALLRLPAGERSWRRLTTAVLDLAVVAVTAAIAGSEYLGWFTGRFGAGASAWWLTIAMMAIAVAGVVVVVKIMTASRSPVSRAALWCLAPIGLAGPLSTVLMTVLRPWPHLNGSAAVLPFVGLFGVLAAYAQKRSLTGAARPPRPGAHRSGTTVPIVATILTSVLIAAAYLRTGHLSTVQVAGMTVLLVLVVARQAVALAENATLLDTVEHQVMHDELTGLHNRRYFAAACAGGDRAVVLVDLRDFRAVNDGLGPEAGDALLVAYGERLTRLAGDHAVVARLGGDEFGIALPGAASSEGASFDAAFSGAAFSGAEAVVDRLLAAAGEPLHAAGHDVLVDASIGIADSYRRAEIALRESVQHTSARPVRYDASLECELNQRATIAANLRRALTDGEFHLLYQPVVALPGGEMYGVESLVRWTLPSGEVVSPADFIPVAEDTGLILELGAWILDEAIAQAAAWRHRHGPGRLHSVAVNVSARQLLDPALPELVAAALSRHGVPAGQMTIEITETAVFGGGRALATVRALSDMGLAIALDDFGTGHSSLGLLRTCPVDAIKVDKSFVDGLGGTPQQEAIATAVIGIAETMGLHTVAEGVESPDQARRLHQLGYRLAQGFHFARPLPASAIDDLLTQPDRAAA
jgi:diguanylate cyclase (GGDEF)-like protein